MAGPAAQRTTLAFVLALTVYFAAQAGLRLALGGALETDEAEMMVMTPGLAPGYGPQLPLYNWFQIGLFELFGRSLFSLALLKNLLLWGSYLFLFLGLRLWIPAGAAALGAMSLFLLPDLAWEAQRATTHSNILFTTSMATIAAFLWAMRDGSRRAWVVLGVALGLGGLSKYNFWMVPGALALAALTLPQMRAGMLCRRALIAPALAVLVVAIPYGWMVQNPDLAFSSASKMRLNGASADWVRGVRMAAAGGLTLMAPALLAAGAMWVFGRRRAKETTAPVPALLLRAAVLLLLIILLGIWQANVGHVTQRWMLPVAFLAVPGIFVWLAPRTGPRAVSGFCLLIALIALLVMAGLSYDRFKEGARRDVEFAPLPERIETIAPNTPVIAEFFTAGNLARLRPGWQVAPYLGFARARFGGQRVLFLLRENVPPSLETGLQQAGWPSDSANRTVDAGSFTLPYGHSEAALPLRWYLVDVPR
ncbi:dolichyl-phosphate-mannose-protein mannosyltransferase [Rhodovulum imhoffii]|uniref:Dolichyl-phosphate-mannose-protein mannosyltransferase n=1 Tax=Rhodovulum imhoffii TaxID=365340 RepID=A0A2T5BUM2_9RHOB|nr:glycosyltransferase family 39 protein [Rhodovulum imhoffii]MBK5934806.1 hypothetical protein [Rhodovulum imhoffii]PTN03208.1 dolichyl-phosphate-mannose-protein mannosyltransferase [Rhodovulum imhoffii]